MRGPIITALIVLCPFVIHLSIILGVSQYGIIYLFLGMSLLFADRAGMRLRLLLLIAIPIVIFWILSEPVLAVYALYLFPVMVCLLFFSLFARTLRAGAIPLVTQMAILVHGEIDEHSRRYTRVLTKVWAVFFVLLALESALLAMFASFELWSLFTNIINYGLILLVFLGDFLFRKKLLPSWHNATFVSFIASITKVKIKDMK